MMTTIAMDSEAPISHPLSTMIMATADTTKPTDTMANSVTTRFMVAKVRISEARTTLISIPLMALVKKAFSPSM
jgi:hypothetical protein